MTEAVKKVGLAIAGIAVALAVVIPAQLAIFQFTCADHSWHTFWRWLLRAGCQ